HGLTKTFGSLRAVDGVDIRINRGEIVGFLGPNGSGKTTTIRMICGLMTPDSGAGSVVGHDIRDGGEQIRAQTGYMTQRFSLYGDLSIVENLLFLAKMHGIAKRHARVDRVIEEIGLTKRREQLAATLSGGWKQRLALAAAVI